MSYDASPTPSARKINSRVVAEGSDWLGSASPRPAPKCGSGFHDPASKRLDYTQCRRIQKESRTRRLPRGYRALARAYQTSLGVGDETHAWREAYAGRGQIRWYSLESIAKRRRPNEATIIRATLGGWGERRGGTFGLAVGGLRTIRHLVLDVDVHDLDRRLDERDLDVDDWLDRRRRRREGHEIISEAARPVVETLRRRFPALAPLVWRTRRGAHVLVLLEEVENVDRAHEAARALAEVVREELGEACPSIEAFPTADGRTCRLPCTGASRLLSDDLVTLAHSRRWQDLATLTDEAPRVSLDALGLDLDDRASDQRAPRRQARPALRVVGPPEGLLGGDDYADEVLRIVEEGIADDDSWNALRRIAFAARIGCGLSRELSLRAWDRLIESGEHGATHCQTESGVKELRYRFEKVIDYYEQGIDEGRLRPGLMRGAPRAAILELAGLSCDSSPAGSARAKKDPEEVAKARRRAVCERWRRYYEARGEHDKAARKVEEIREIDRLATAA